jgi:predicted dehydrogenase
MGLSTVRWGVIGCGQIACDKMIPAIQAAANAELAAVSDVSEDRLRLVAERVPHVPRYADYAELLSTGEVDAVYVALPNALHHDAVLAAAAAGKHVLCEKP